MPNKKIGNNKELIGCLLHEGCLWSTPCKCINCTSFNYKKLLLWLKEINNY